MPNRAEILKQKFQDSLALPFEQVLSEAVLQNVLEAQGVSYRQTLYTPVVTLWAWMSQVLDADKSLSNAVSRVIAWLAAAGVAIPSADTGAYSKARKRLSLEVLHPLLKQTAQALQSEVKAEQRWCGRRVKAYDGTTVTMSDTPANQKCYPQHSNQLVGCGFPLAKLVVWFCVTTGAVLEVSMAAFTTSEWELSRQLYAPRDFPDKYGQPSLEDLLGLADSRVVQGCPYLSRNVVALLQPDDVVVADSAYGTYVDLTLVHSANADAVFRKHHARHCDFRRGKKLGIGDHIVRWQRPQRCPTSMSPEDFAALPASIEVREVHLLIQQPGFRPKEIILVTTLLESKRYPKARLAELYQLRWLATEVNFKHLKTTLKMEMIWAKTPQMVQKEIWVHLLAYNLLRTLMWQSAQQIGATTFLDKTGQPCTTRLAMEPTDPLKEGCPVLSGNSLGVSPLQISLQGTRQHFNQFRPVLSQATAQQRHQLYTTLLEVIHNQLVPLRPNRVEPRVTKRRPKSFPRMQQPRSVLKAKLVA